MPDTWSDMSDISATTVTVAQLGRRISGVQKNKEINDKGEKKVFIQETEGYYVSVFQFFIWWLLKEGGHQLKALSQKHARLWSL